MRADLACDHGSSVFCLGPPRRAPAESRAKRGSGFFQNLSQSFEFLTGANNPDETLPQHGPRLMQAVISATKGRRPGGASLMVESATATGSHKLTRYQTVLYLLLAVAVFHVVYWNILVVQRPDLIAAAVTISVVAVLILFGVWVQSAIVSFAGVIWMLFWAGTIIWPVVSSERFSVLLVILAALILSDRGIMSTQRFRTEFSYERQHQPKYKRCLKRVASGAVFAGLVISTILLTTFAILALCCNGARARFVWASVPIVG